MAKALPDSLMLHALALPRAIVTDSNDPELFELFTHRVEYRTEYDSNVRQKIMYLDKYSPFPSTEPCSSIAILLSCMD